MISNKWWAANDQHFTQEQKYGFKQILLIILLKLKIVLLSLTTFSRLLLGLITFFLGLHNFLFNATQSLWRYNRIITRQTNKVRLIDVLCLKQPTKTVCKSPHGLSGKINHFYQFNQASILHEIVAVFIDTHLPLHL